MSFISNKIKHIIGGSTMNNTKILILASLFIFLSAGSYGQTESQIGGSDAPSKVKKQLTRLLENTSYQ